MENKEQRYFTALKESRAAFATFQAAREKYRARVIGDAEFLAAREQWAFAQLTFDIAERDLKTID